MADNKKFKELYLSSFKDARNWVNWFFSVIVQDRDIISITGEDDVILSGGLLQDYEFSYHGKCLRGGYLSCVATRPQERGRGLAGEVVSRSLQMAQERGMAVVSLIPAQRHLYDFYARAGFSGVYYMNEERYLPGHKFECCGREVPADYELLHRLETSYGCGVIHSEEQFKYLVTDLNFEKGTCVIGAEDADGNPAVLFARYDNENPDAAIEVKALLAGSEVAAEMALYLLSERVPGRSIIVRTEPSDATGPLLRAAGMLRITDAESVLSALAAGSPQLRTTIRVHDEIIEKNNAVFTLKDGKCSVSADGRHPDLDVDISIITAILFSSSSIGSVFNLPTHRPLMTMMLD